MSTFKIEAIHEYKPKEWNGKFFHEFSVDGQLDGKEKHGIVVSFFSPNNSKPNVNVGDSVEVEFNKTFHDVEQYKGRLARSGGGGGGARPTRNEGQIVAQSSIKSAVEYFSSLGSHDHSPEDVIDVAERFMKWVLTK